MIVIVVYKNILYISIFIKEKGNCVFWGEVFLVKYL